MKPIKAWAVVGTRDSLALFNGQCPVFWLRRIAQQYDDQMTGGAGRVVRVDIREVPRKAKR